MIFDQYSAEIRHLASKHDGPFYVYSLASLRQRVRELRKALPENVDLFYSFKANSHPEIIKTIRSEGLKADVASSGELEIALTSEFKGSEIEFTGPGKTRAELEAAIRAEVVVILESAQELELLNQVAKEVGTRARATARLLPRRKINHIGRELLNDFSQFGLDEFEAQRFSKILPKCEAVDLIGTHSHVQSQILEIRFAIENFRAAAEEAINFSRLAPGLPLNQVNLGGGIGIPYAASDSTVSTSELGREITRLVEELKASAELKTARFQFEFGRFFIGEAGAFATKVLYTKTSRGKRVAITDGGFTQSQIACGVGQVVRRNLPVRALTSKASSALEEITIAGPSCYGLDILAQDAKLPPLAPGDVVVIENVGAYGYTFSPQRFLRQREAAEFFV